MISEDYEKVLSTSKHVEKEILRCISQVYKGDIANINRKLFIPCGVAVIDRYIEAVYVDGQEIATLEISGRAIDIMRIGYRCK